MKKLIKEFVKFTNLNNLHICLKGGQNNSLGLKSLGEELEKQHKIVLIISEF
jgi:hypothetical protein